MDKTPINDGGPAFPVQLEHITTYADKYGVPIADAASATGCHPGMTLRDWLAGQHQINRDNDGELDVGFSGQLLREGFNLPTPAPRDVVAWIKLEAELEARIKYIHADAMLAAREVKP